MKIRNFIPGNVSAPRIPVVKVTEEMRVSGRIRMPKGTARGVMVDGVVVSWAVAQLADVNGVRRVTVETDVKHRKKGYATACLQALVRDVKAPLLYQCEEKNVNSAKTALRAGFVEIVGVVRD